jgi:uncharacterized protein YndB with AHSA1/START domain
MTDANLIKTIILKAPPETVFPYLVESDLLAKWFHQSDQELCEGRSYALMSTDRPGEKILWGEVLVCQPPHHLVYTFTHPHLSEHVTTVSFTLEACEAGTKLTLVHEGLGNGPADAISMLTSHDKGWDDHLGQLREAMVE